jgi:hypothetical protein
MIADLKADSQRWQEERAQASRRNATGRSAQRAGGSPDHSIPYTVSKTHEARQMYGPSEFQETPQPTHAQLQQSYEEVNRGPPYGESAQQTGWEQQQYYAPQNQGQSISQAQGFQPGYTQASHVPSEPYSSQGQYQFVPGAAYSTPENNHPRTSTGYPGYPPAQNPGQQYVESRGAPQGYGQAQPGNPSAGLPPPRQTASRDSYGRNDPYSGR